MVYLLSERLKAMEPPQETLKNHSKSTVYISRAHKINSDQEIEKILTEYAQMRD